MDGTEVRNNGAEAVEHEAVEAAEAQAEVASNGEGAATHGVAETEEAQAEMVDNDAEAVEHEAEEASVEVSGTEAVEAAEAADDDFGPAVEAILFTTGRAVSSEELARACGTSTAEMRSFVRDFAEAWNAASHGTDIIELDDSWQMCTRREYYPQLITLELHPRKPHLTDVVLETLSVIAYKQPVTKAEIERIRGVNSDHAVNKLVEFHLVEELGRAKQPGRPILFGTTREFLRVFGVSSKENLPEISPVQLADFRVEAEAEAGRQTDASGTAENGKPEQAAGAAENGTQARASDTTENGKQAMAFGAAENGTQARTSDTTENGKQAMASGRAENGKQEQPAGTAEKGKQTQAADAEVASRQRSYEAAGGRRAIGQGTDAAAEAGAPLRPEEITIERDIDSETTVGI